MAMMHVYNASTNQVNWQGYAISPGYAVLPLSGGVAYISPAGDVEVKHPDYVQSFGAGFLVIVPFATVLIIRNFLRLLKPNQLDRYV